MAHAWRSRGPAPPAFRSPPASDFRALLWVSPFPRIPFFFSVPPECSLCAQIPISKQDQAKNWQDRESAWATLGGSLEMRRTRSRMHHQFDKKYEGTNPVLPGRREVLIAGMGVLAAPLLTSTANASAALVNVGAMESLQGV